MSDQNRVISCLDCGRPWGIVPSRTNTVENATLAMHEAYGEYWEAAWWGDDAPPHPELPELTLTSVVYISESNAVWLADRFGCEMFCDGPCWQELDATDVPTWWAKRRIKMALRWDCCDLPSPLAIDIELTRA